jgi:hypothetical protein
MFVVLGIAAVLAVALGYRLVRITVPLIETFSDREIYDAYAARAFYTKGYTLFNPPIQKNIAFGVLDNQFELYPFVVALGYRVVGGESIVFARLVSIAFALLSIVMLYKIAAFSKDRLAGLFAALILAISPVHVYFSRAVFAESMLMFLWLASIYFFLSWTETRRTSAYALSLGAMILGVLVKIFPVVFMAALLPYGAIKVWRSRRHLVMVFAYAALPTAGGLYWYLVKTKLVKTVEVQRFAWSEIWHIPEFLFRGYQWRVPDDPRWFFALAGIGFIWTLVKIKDRAPIMLVTLGTVGYLVMVVSRMSAHPYYSMHLVPAGALLVGSALSLGTRWLWEAWSSAPKSAQTPARALTAAALVIGAAVIAQRTVPLAAEYYGERLVSYPNVAEISSRLRLLDPSATIVGIDGNVGTLTENYYFDRPGYHMTSQHMPQAVSELEDHRHNYRPPADTFACAFTYLMPKQTFLSSDLNKYLKAHFTPVFLHEDFVVYDLREETTPEKSAVVTYDFNKQPWPATAFSSENVGEYRAPDVGYAYNSGDVPRDGLLVFRVAFPRPLSRLFLRLRGRAHPTGGVLEPYVSVDGRDFVQAGVNAVEEGATYDLTPLVGDSREAYVMFRLRAGGGWTILSGFELHEVFAQADRQAGSNGDAPGIRAARGLEVHTEGAFLETQPKGFVFDRDRQVAVLANRILLEGARPLAPSDTLVFKELGIRQFVAEPASFDRAKAQPTGGLLLTDARSAQTVIDVPSTAFVQGGSFEMTAKSAALRYDLRGDAMLQLAEHQPKWRLGHMNMAYPLGAEGITYHLHLPIDAPSTVSIEGIFSNYRNAKRVEGTIWVSQDGVNFVNATQTSWKDQVGKVLKVSVPSPGSDVYVKVTVSESDSSIGMERLKMTLETPLPKEFPRVLDLTLRNTSRSAFTIHDQGRMVPSGDMTATVEGSPTGRPLRISVKSDGCRMSGLAVRNTQGVWMAAPRDAVGFWLPSASGRLQIRVRVEAVADDHACRVDGFEVAH